MDAAITPESVLSSVVRITEQRSQQHLEDSLVTTLADLADLSFCAICRPTQTASGIFIDYVAMRAAPGIETPESVMEIGGDLLLLQCMATGGAHDMPLADGSIRRARAVVDDRGTVCAFLVSVTPPGRTENQPLVDGFAAIYRNYLAILRDAARDTLTGLKNRKTFDENFSRIVASSRHFEIPYAGDRRNSHLDGDHHWLGMIDIDHFKRINDTFGHVFGDEVLLLLAALMRKAFRGEDLLFRFGGEEFVVMLAPTTFESAKTVFDRFRTTVSGFLFPQVGTVTVSIGFVRIQPEDLPSVVIGNADKALYFAKEHGRNQVCSFEQLRDDGRLEPERQSGDDIELFG